MSDTELILQRLESIELRLENIELTLSKVKHRALTPAEKMQRYRAKRRAAVTEKVTVTSVTKKVTPELETVTDAVTIPVTSVTSPRALINVPSLTPVVTKVTTSPLPERKRGVKQKETRPAPGTKRGNLWDLWLEVTGRTGRCEYDAHRKAKLEWALTTYPVIDCEDAVHGITLSPHHMGQNEGGVKYNDLRHIFADAERLEKFRDLWRNKHKSNGPVKPNGSKPHLDQAQLMQRLAEDLESESRHARRVEA